MRIFQEKIILYKYYLILIIFQSIYAYFNIRNEMWGIGDIYSNVFTSYELKKAWQDGFAYFFDKAYLNRGNKGHFLSLAYLPFLYLLNDPWKAHDALVILFQNVFLLSIFFIFKTLSKKSVASALGALVVTNFYYIDEFLRSYDTYLIFAASFWAIAARACNKEKVLKKFDFCFFVFGSLAFMSRPFESTVLLIIFIAFFGRYLLKNINFWAIIFISLAWWVPGAERMFSHLKWIQNIPPSADSIASLIHPTLLILTTCSFFMLLRNGRQIWRHFQAPFRKGIIVLLVCMFFVPLAYLSISMTNLSYFFFPFSIALAFIVGVLVVDEQKKNLILISLILVALISLKFRNEMGLNTLIKSDPFYKKKFSEETLFAVKRIVENLKNHSAGRVILIYPRDVPLVNKIRIYRNLIQLFTLAHGLDVKFEQVSDFFTLENQNDNCEHFLSFDHLLVVEWGDSNRAQKKYNSSLGLLTEFNYSDHDILFHTSMLGNRVNLLKNPCPQTRAEAHIPGMKL